MRDLTLPLLATGLLAAAPAHAACDRADIINDATRTARVRPGAMRVHFVQSDAIRRGCPGAGAACKIAAYVVPGDIVLVAHREGAFTCAAFADARGTATILFLPTGALTPIPPASAEGFAGAWIAPEQTLDIRPAAAGAYHVRGNATWGMGDPWRVRNGGIHTGEVEGVARPTNGVLAFTEGNDATLPYDRGEEYDCRLRLLRRGPYLLARDNNYCGGMNVSFSGLYVRKPARSPRS